MGRKKVKSEKISPSQPKEREVEPKKVITFIPNDSKNKWNKIKGVDGNIVRFKTNDPERQEYLKNKTYDQLYVGVDGNDLYIYYSIK
jgi:hypothetical protein